MPTDPLKRIREFLDPQLCVVGNVRQLPLSSISQIFRVGGFLDPHYSADRFSREGGSISEISIL